MEMLIVGLSGFVGAIARYLIYLTEAKYKIAEFPYGTLIINTLGCLLAGLLLGWSDRLMPEQRQTVSLVSLGFIGSFTTFSTFSAETFHLIKTGQLPLAVLNILLSLGLGLLTVWLGSLITR